MAIMTSKIGHEDSDDSDDLLLCRLYSYNDRLGKRRSGTQRLGGGCVSAFVTERVFLGFPTSSSIIVDFDR